MLSKSDLEDQFSDYQIFRVLSFGGGTQSAWLLDQHILGNINYDLIAFADTGAEPQFIHDQVTWWQDRMIDQGCNTPFVITRHRSMSRGLEEMLFRYILTDYQRFQLPAFTEGTGMLPRQCTVDFKIVPVKQATRKVVMERYGLKPTQRFTDDVVIMIDIGFAEDESRRAKRNQSPQYKYVQLAYPMIDYGITVEDSLVYLHGRGYPDKRSRCYLCPFNCDKPVMPWQEIIDAEPLSFLKACWFDAEIRRVLPSKNLRSAPYLHYSRRPLAHVYSAEYEELFVRYESELTEWIAENEGYVQAKYLKGGEAR